MMLEAARLSVGTDDVVWNAMCALTPHQLALLRKFALHSRSAVR